jgi:ribonuclease HI
MTQRITIYTDGSSLKNPGPSGWAYLMFIGGSQLQCAGGEKHSTNNRMELMAVIKSLEILEDYSFITVVSDSQLTIKCAKGEWKRKANVDLWDKFNLVSKTKEIEWKWVKAHNGDEFNEVVDKLAREEARKLSTDNQED